MLIGLVPRLTLPGPPNGFCFAYPWLYEYACHEANYALSNILSGARYQERMKADGSRDGAEEKLYRRKRLIYGTLGTGAPEDGPSVDLSRPAVEMLTF